MAQNKPAIKTFKGQAGGQGSNIGRAGQHENINNITSENDFKNSLKHYLMKKGNRRHDK